LNLTFPTQLKAICWVCDPCRNRLKKSRW